METLLGSGLIAFFVAAAAQAFRFQRGLQRTIDHLRERLETAEKDIRECLADRAALRTELEMLKKGRDE